MAKKYRAEPVTEPALAAMPGNFTHVLITYIIKLR